MQNAKMIDLTGQKYGRLRVLRFDHFKYQGKHKTAFWFCQCDCGNTALVPSASLRKGATRSCGCLRREISAERAYKGGRSKLYSVWTMMIKRCNDATNEFYPNYGGRGISVCDEWSCGYDGYMAFRKWAESNGYRDGLTIDRINNDLGYCPDNCRWVTRKFQSNNKRNNRRIRIKNEVKTLAQWCEKYDAPYDRTRIRINNGWDALDALTTPRYKTPERK